MNHEEIRDAIGNWVASTDYCAAFEHAVENQGIHPMKFVAYMHKHMLETQDFSPLPHFINAIHQSKVAASKAQIFKYIAFSIVDGRNNFKDIMSILTPEQQNTILPFVLQNHPQHCDEFEKILKRPISEDTVWFALLTNLNALNELNALSSRMPANHFFDRLQKVFNSSYPSGGVKTFALWLSLPTYSLEMNNKEFMQFNSMVDFLGTQPLEKRYIQTLDFAKKILSYHHDITHLQTFIERSKIVGSLDVHTSSDSAKRKM